jgi:hypothetical protein
VLVAVVQVVSLIKHGSPATGLVVVAVLPVRTVEMAATENLAATALLALVQSQ